MVNGWALGWEGAGVVIREADSEGRSSRAQYPLHISSEAPSRTLPGQVCLCGGAQTSVQEQAKAVVREVGLMGNSEKSLHMLLKEGVLLLKAQQDDSGNMVHEKIINKTTDRTKIKQNLRTHHYFHFLGQVFCHRSVL